jgi:hypothetical protein
VTLSGIASGQHEETVCTHPVLPDARPAEHKYVSVLFSLSFCMKSISMSTFLPLIFSLYDFSNPLNDQGVVGTSCEPWLVRDSIVALDCLMVEGDELDGLEWGSGSSSMWLVTRLRSLISIDNSQEWVNHVQGFFAAPNSVGYGLVNLGSEEKRLINWVGDDSKRWRESSLKEPLPASMNSTEAPRLLNYAIMIMSI